MPAPSNRWKLRILGKIEHSEGERRGVLAGRICAGDEEANEAVVFQVRDSGWL